MATNVHNLKVGLKLRWLHGSEYEATVSVEITDTCYKELELCHGLPHGTVGSPEVAYLEFEFSHEGEQCGQIVRTVSKTTHVSSSGKIEVTAFAVVNGQEAGHASEAFPRRE